MVEYESRFVANFKIGDNIVYNLKCLTVLYQGFQTSNAEDKLVLIKPMIIQIASISEAILYDFDFRIKKFNREGVGALKEAVINAIRHTRQDEFAGLIKKAKTHKLFDSADSDLYNGLDAIRIMRNRVHIQNKWSLTVEEKEVAELKTLDKVDECYVFTLERLWKAEKTLEFLIRTMIDKYKRPNKTDYVQNFILPWNSHF